MKTEPQREDLIRDKKRNFPRIEFFQREGIKRKRNVTA